MKKAFSLMEIVIATVLLSVLITSLFQIKSNNIFFLDKSLKSKKEKEYILMTIDTTNYDKRNKNVYIDKLFNIQDDELRQELKQVKIKIKDEILNSRTFEANNINIKISEFKTSYSNDKSVKKDIYRFKIEL